MAKTKGVWGIDIGQSALKALRCHTDEDGKIVADSYDFIEYPKALSLPDADEEALVNEAFETFLSRNEVRGDYVAMTVSGQSGLSRFFKPPPVDSRTLPEIVKYEVRQQIPFPIEDVIWDWQGMGGTEMDNVIVDAEVGLFAIKRDTVYTALQPFLKKDIEVDLVQLSPLAIHNVVCKELIGDIPSAAELDLDNMPDSMVILSMGTDATDLIVTNGVKLWLRNIPIGGNHFTKELSRELKLTHAKAEHLKRNARQAEDPKTVFQAMRRVFNDLKKEIDRSLQFYAGMDKNSSLDRIVLLGNAARLPGLRQYLNKQLEMDIAKISEYSHLTGPIPEERAFKENLLSFAPAYGLCLQGLKQAQMNTNLLPVEFVNERIIRAKKPWVLASVSLLMLGMLFSYFFINQRWWGVNEDYSREGVSWKQASAEVDDKARTSGTFKLTDDELNTKLNRINAISSELSEASETQAAWPELLSALDQVVPRDPRMLNPDGTLSLVANPDDIPFSDREEIYIDYIETKFEPDVAPWLQKILDAYRYQQDIVVAGTVPGKKQSKYAKKKATEYDVTGSGFIVEIAGHHFYNSPDRVRESEHGSAFVTKRFLAELIHGEISLKNAAGVLEQYKFEDIGVFYPTLIAEQPHYAVKIPNPNFGQEGKERKDEANGDNGGQQNNQDRDDANEGEGRGGGPRQELEEEQVVPEFFDAYQYDFKVQFIFMPNSPAQRDAAKKQRLADEAKEAAEEAKTNRDDAAKGGPAEAPRQGRPAEETKIDPVDTDPGQGDAKKPADDAVAPDAVAPDAVAPDAADPEGGQPKAPDPGQPAEGQG